MQKNSIMKFPKTLTTLCIVLALCCSACKDKLFDFDLQNIEADGEWGIPVFNGTVSMNKLLQNLDSVNYIQVGDNGTLKFVLENELENVVRLGDIYRIEDKQIDSSGVVDVTSLPSFQITQVIQFSLNTEEFMLQTGIFKSGILTLNFSIDNAAFIYTADLTSNEIFNENDVPITMHFSNNQQQQTINLSNYTVWPNAQGNILFTAQVVIQSAVDLDQITYNSSVTLQNFSIHSVTGRFKAISHQFNSKTVFNLDLNPLRFDQLQLNNAKTSIYVKNSLCRIDGSLNEMYLYGANGAYSPLITSVLNFSIPTSPNQYVHVIDANIPVLNYNPDLDSLGIDCNLLINPEGFAAGDISLNENSSLDIKFKTELPANISISNAVYKDTIDNGLYQQLNSSIIHSIELLTIRVAYINSFPFSLIPQIDFLNSSTGEIYHLALNDLQIHGSYNDIPYQQAPIYIEIRDTDAQKVANSDKIILYFKMTTDNNTVEIKDSQYIQANIGAKVKYSNINM